MSYNILALLIADTTKGMCILCQKVLVLRTLTIHCHIFIFSFFRVSFVIAGHTIFNVDRFFSKIAISYNRSDIFNVDDLAAHVVTDTEGELVKCWREQLSQKFTKLPCIRSLHYFVMSGT